MPAGKHIAIVLTLFSAFFISGCGFEPLYAEHQDTSVARQMATIKVTPLKARIGQIVYTKMVNDLTPQGLSSAPNYRLNITLGETREGLGFEQDEAVTRFNYRLSSTYKLIDTATNKTVFEATSRSISSYNVIENQYATLVARRDAEDRAARDLADNMKLRLSLYFRHNQE